MELTFEFCKLHLGEPAEIRIIRTRHSGFVTLYPSKCKFKEKHNQLYAIQIEKENKNRKTYNGSYSIKLTDLYYQSDLENLLNLVKNN